MGKFIGKNFWVRNCGVFWGVWVGLGGAWLGGSMESVMVCRLGSGEAWGLGGNFG